QKSWIIILNILHKDYAKYNELISKIPDMQGLQKNINVMIKDFEKREAMKNSNTSN
ncbi:unnamed protein product, partial [marine sediment metagenome]